MTQLSSDGKLFLQVFAAATGNGQWYSSASATKVDDEQPIMQCN